MTENDKLDLILEKIGSMDQSIQQLSVRIDSIEQRMDSMERRMDSMEKDIQGLKCQLTNSTEELRNMDTAILDEVERVHNILNRHIANKSVHTA